ncbi:MAG: lipopolysaccharide transport periplasmic protein LptA [Paraglaciecola sp.]|uniref:lipopolysaccharide transport periplasmic protein LptA n=1 Tax=Pseudomonadati TaxID=3379134 RepID=UPI00273D8C42|nr:lipopolysaccharide transport periplasmic protein LptA [Paraglaciecola sp.]MDP5030654.1 lipopolysaccharide transport periplasmic protein LptA [Paraglaciecola sp.]MDP5130266.1 lipopolysaccharide transport periplasmic protein LptA [Paraglaciecola sp.]
MLKPYSNLLLGISLSLAVAYSPQSYAGKDDFSKTIEIASQQSFLDRIAKKSIYKGNVLITQGTLVLKADEMEIDAGAGQDKEVFIATGSPAEYSQMQENGKLVRATANKIEYHRQTRTLSLEGNAEVEQNSSSVKGNSIVFNMELEQIMAQGQDQNSGRVITILQPESKNTKNQTSPEQDQQP